MRTILIVESQPAACASEAALREADFEPHFATTGHEAAHLASVLMPRVILAERILSDMSGTDLFTRLRYEIVPQPLMLVVAESAATSDEVVVLLSVADYVAKPLSGARLARLLEFHLAIWQPFIMPSGRQPVGSRGWTAASALALMRRNFAMTTLTVSSVASELGVSVEHVCRVVKHETAGTFHQHLARLRTAYACWLLRTTRLSVKEIAYRCGFQRACQFDRTFKRVLGTSPTTYRDPDVLVDADINHGHGISTRSNRFGL